MKIFNEMSQLLFFGSLYFLRDWKGLKDEVFLKIKNWHYILIRKEYWSPLLFLFQ